MPMTAEEIAEAYLKGLPRDELLAMQEAGGLVIECFRVLMKTEDSIVGEMLKTAEEFYEWDHYPEGDVYDGETHSQYYYHAHPPDERPGEHGHFHTFLRPGGMPAGCKPAAVPDYKPPEDPDDALSHLVSISMDEKGFPLKLFTVNRWVTDEVWYVAEDVKRFVALFKIDHAQPSWPVNLWISNMMVLFRPQICDLLESRDAAIADWAVKHPGEDPYRDHGIEVTSEMDIDVDAQMAAIAEALAHAG
jgi:hypothetical protein